MRHARILLLVTGLGGGCASGEAPVPATETRAPPRFDAAGDEETWRTLTPAAPRLPAWARTLAESLPSTTAFHLDLDHAMRQRNPLGPAMSARIRWVVADANRCAYSKESAAADLAATPVGAGRLEDLSDPGSLPEPDRTALTFARRLTLEASAITDEEVAALIDAWGPDDAVAVVHTVCYANFQDRIALALGLGPGEEPGGPAAAVEGPPPGTAPRLAPPRDAPVPGVDSGAASSESLPPWSERTLDGLRAAVEQQRTLAARIPPPDAVRRTRLPRPMRARLGRIAWGTVGLGYQPELTRAWFRTMETFEEEGALDQVFASSVFWVVTRTSDCFY